MVSAPSKGSIVGTMGGFNRQTKQGWPSGHENAEKTHCPRGHAYADLAQHRGGRRYCRQCARWRNWGWRPDLPTPRPEEKGTQWRKRMAEEAGESFTRLGSGYVPAYSGD